MKPIWGLLFIFFVSCQSTPPAMTRDQARQRAQDAQTLQPQGPNITKIAILGDSVSSGINADFPGGNSFGWVDRFKELVQTLEKPYRIDNYAFPGALAYQWTFDQRLAAIWSDTPDVVVILIGGNDGLAMVRDGEVDPQETEDLQEGYRTIINKIQTQLPKVKIILVSYYDLFDGLSTHTGPGLKTFHGVSKLMQDTRTFLKSLADEKKLGFFDLYPLFLHRAYGREFGDNQALYPAYVRPLAAGLDIHPNTQGHLAIAQGFFDFFKSYAANF